MNARCQSGGEHSSGEYQQCHQSRYSQANCKITTRKPKIKITICLIVDKVSPSLGPNNLIPTQDPVANPLLRRSPVPPEELVIIEWAGIRRPNGNPMKNPHNEPTGSGLIRSHSNLLPVLVVQHWTVLPDPFSSFLCSGKFASVSV